MNKYVKIAAACAAVAAAAGLGIFASGVKKEEASVPTFSEEVEVPTKVMATTDPLPDNWDEVYGYSPSSEGLTERAKQLMRENPDVVGWIKIDKTRVDYPVLMDPGEVADNSPFYGEEGCDPNFYYLHRDLDRSYKYAGSLFMDFRDRFGSREEEQSENLIIYGHNMLYGDMFGDLRKYRMDLSFYEKSPFIQLSSNYKDYDYVIFAFLITSGNYYETDFRYWYMEELDTKEDFDFYVDKCNEGAMIKTGIDVEYGDKILTLQTCADTYNDSRFLVVARRLRDGEVAGDMSTIQRTEEYIKEHQTEPSEPDDKNKEEEEAQQ